MTQGRMSTDWLSRSTTNTEHEEAPLAEEYVRNEAKRRLDGRPIEYDLKRKELVKTVKENDWTEANKTKYPDYFRVREDLTIREGLLFKRGTKLFQPKEIEDKSSVKPTDST